MIDLPAFSAFGIISFEIIGWVMLFGWLEREGISWDSRRFMVVGDNNLRVNDNLQSNPKSTKRHYHALTSLASRIPPSDYESVLKSNSDIQLAQRIQLYFTSYARHICTTNPQACIPQQQTSQFHPPPKPSQPPTQPPSQPFQTPPPSSPSPQYTA